MSGYTDKLEGVRIIQAFRAFPLTSFLLISSVTGSTSIFISDIRIFLRDGVGDPL